MKFLILRFSSIGDIVLTTPVVRCLKKKFPGAEIHYATKAAFHQVLQHNPYITKIHLLRNSINKLAAELKKENFDYIIDLHHNQRTLLLKFLLEQNSSSFNKLNFEKWLMVNLKINLLPNKHIVDRYLDTCSALEVENDGEGLDYFTGHEDTVTLPSGFENGYIGWVIGAKQNTKKFPSAKIIAALKHIQYPVMLLGGKEDTAEGDAIIAALKGTSALVYNAAGQCSLNQSAGLVKLARLIVTNDTGLAHIAAAYKRPTISLWGNTIPEFGMYPYQTEHIAMQVKGLDCRPCSKLGYGTCPQSHFNCMNLQDENILAGKINEMYVRG